MIVNTILRLFCIIVSISIFVLVVVGGVGLFAGLPRWQAVVFIVGNAISYFVTMYGVSEFMSGRRMGVIWIPIGIGLNYIVAREVWPTISKKWPKPLVRTHMSRLIELLGFGLRALLLVIILVLSGRSDFPPFGFPW